MTGNDTEFGPLASDPPGLARAKAMHPSNRPSAEVLRWADGAMYRAEPLEQSAKSGRRGHIMPRVHLLWMTPDPLGAIAAACKMYEGGVARSLSDVTHEERQRFWKQVTKTHLKAPFEFVQFHFLLEGVTRSFTHQLVRQRTATYAQESLRFAVKDDIDEEVSLPPSLRSRPDDDPLVVLWHAAVNKVDDTYHALVDGGIPAEDARGLLPHAITTRAHYTCDLRALLEHAGNRLCTQAQFEWRSVAIGIMQAIRDNSSTYWKPHDTLGIHPDPSGWQWKVLAAARPETFTPVCYKAGHCVFMGQLDRGCTIRDRVNAGQFEQINVEEWAANPWAGITTEDNVRPA